MFEAILQFVASAAVIITAGVYLTKAVDHIADSTGLGRVLAGGIFLAAATSLPELSVDLHAIKMGEPDLAIGDLLGSSLFNLLILALLDFGFPSTFRRTAFSSAYLHHALSATLGILVTAFAGLAILVKSETSILGAGPISWIILVTYLYGIRLIYIDRPSQRAQSSCANRAAWKHRPFLLAVARFVGCAAIILWTAPYLTVSADRLAALSGLGHSFVGTIFLALSTSMPELVSTFVAFRMGAPDLALGNIFGSNIFNMILLVPLDMAFTGNLFSAVKSVHAITALGVVSVMCVALMGMLYRKKERAHFAEPSSELVVILIAVFLFIFFRLNH